jgi:hypothetical protein
MDEPALARYKAQCEWVKAQYNYDYTNTELEELMKLSQWEAIKKQLTTSERKQIKGYLNYIQDRSLGYLNSQISNLEALVSRIKLLLNPKPLRKGRGR